MDIPEFQQYNLPGFGFMRIRLFPHSRRVFEFLEHYGHVSCLQQIDQLGPIRDVLPGAHHTRYEYLMAQLALITELCQLEGPLPTGITLSSDRDTFGCLPGCKPPSNGEILQVLALLGNIGHLPTTFSGERAFLKYLRDHTEVRRAFREGLAREDRASFNRTLSAFDVYRLNYFIALFLLHRYRRREDGEEVVAFCQGIIRSFTAHPQPPSAGGVAGLWRLYRNIRRLTYVALDSYYAPVPFSLDLASIFFSLKQHLIDVFLEGSAFHDALARLDGVLQETVYLAPPTLLNHARVTDSILERLETRPERWGGISELWNLLRPGAPEQTFSSPHNGGHLGGERTASMTYRTDPGLASNVLEDPVEWERDAQTAVGLRSCRFGAEFDPPRRHLYVAASLAPGLPPNLAWKISLRVCKQLVDFDLRVRRNLVVPRDSDLRNGMSLLRLLLGGAFGVDRDYRLEARPVVGQSPVAWGYGSTKMSRCVDGYLERATTSESFDADALNEIKMLSEALRDVSYRGCLVCFAGATIVIDATDTVAEFDGIAFLLSREIEDVTMLVVEAKNTTRGQIHAERQLRDQFRRLLVEDSLFDIKHLGSKGAYARLKLPAVETSRGERGKHSALVD